MEKDSEKWEDKCQTKKQNQLNIFSSNTAILFSVHDLKFKVKNRIEDSPQQ